jgi:hypothetical protein
MRSLETHSHPLPIILELLKTESVQASSTYPIVWGKLAVCDRPVVRGFPAFYSHPAVRLYFQTCITSKWVGVQVFNSHLLERVVIMN